MKHIFEISMLALLATVSTANAQVNFSQRAVTQVSTEAQLRAAAGTVNTQQINGVALQPTASGDLFAIHVDNANKESFLRVDASTGAATKLTDQPAIIAQLGSPYANAITLIGGFVYSPTANALYFGDNFNEVNAGEISLIKLDASTGAASLVTRTTDLEALNDHTILPDGTILATRPGSGSIGTVDANTGAYTERLTEADLLAASSGATELPPESIASNPTNGNTFIFCHDDLELFNVPNITATSPTVTRLTQPGLGAVDMHDLAVDEDSNLFGYDVPTDQIIIVRASDGAVSTFPMTEINTALGGGAFSAGFWRGLGARKVNSTQTDLYMSSASNNYGIVRVRFGVGTASAESWHLY